MRSNQTFLKAKSDPDIIVLNCTDTPDMVLMFSTFSGFPSDMSPCDETIFTYTDFYTYMNIHTCVSRIPTSVGLKQSHKYSQTNVKLRGVICICKSVSVPLIYHLYIILCTST